MGIRLGREATSSALIFIRPLDPMFHWMKRSSSQAHTGLRVMTDGHWERTAERYNTSHIADLHALGSSGPSDATLDAVRSHPARPRGLGPTDPCPRALIAI